MTIRLSDLKKNVRTVPVTYMGETVNVSYRPSVITPLFLQEMDNPKTKLPMAQALSRALVTWDVIDDETDLPALLTPEFLAGFGAGLLNVIWQNITADMYVGKAPGATSDAG